MFVAGVRHVNHYREDPYGICTNGCDFELVAKIPYILKKLGYIIFPTIYTYTENNDKINSKRVTETAEILRYVCGNGSAEYKICEDFDSEADTSPDFKKIIGAVNSTVKNLCVIIVTHERCISEGLGSLLIEEDEIKFLEKGSTQCGSINIIQGTVEDLLVKRGEYKCGFFPNMCGTKINTNIPINFNVSDISFQEYELATHIENYRASKSR